MNPGVCEGQVSCQSHEGADIRAGLLRLTKYLAVFEIYTPAVVLQSSEVLGEFRIVLGERMVYSGRAVVHSLVNTGITLLCEATLEEAWLDFDFISPTGQFNNIRAGFEQFLLEWQKNYKILPEYKATIADLQSFMAGLRNWLEQVELGIRSAPAADRLSLEREVVRDVAPAAVSAIDTMIEKFEAQVEKLTEEERPAHRSFLKRQLHPLVLCSPFGYRSYYKPLGYAGDYEVVNMILREPYEGGSLFAKLINVWLLSQAPAQGHRNRLEVIVQRLCAETLRASLEQRSARIYSLGCGPAAEVQRFLRENDIAGRAQFTLVDFNEETLQHAATALDELNRTDRRKASVQLVKKSVYHILKEAGKVVQRSQEQQFDFVYCAGLFDYLTDSVCKRLMNIFYSWLAPGGLLLVTNVDATLNDSRCFRHSLDFFLDWNLIYRTAAQLRALAPDAASPSSCSVTSEERGVNVFLEVRKSTHA